MRLGTAELYAVVEDLPEVRDSLVVHLTDDQRDELLLFVVLAEGHTVDDALRAKVATELRTALSPRHVPDQLVQVPAIHRTLSGNKLEVPVKKILTGTPEAEAAAEGAANPTLWQLSPPLPSAIGRWRRVIGSAVDPRGCPIATGSTDPRSMA